MFFIFLVFVIFRSKQNICASGLTVSLMYTNRLFQVDIQSLKVFKVFISQMTLFKMYGGNIYIHYITHIQWSYIFIYKRNILTYTKKGKLLFPYNVETKKSNTINNKVSDLLIQILLVWIVFYLYYWKAQLVSPLLGTWSSKVRYIFLSALSIQD